MSEFDPALPVVINVSGRSTFTFSGARPLPTGRGIPVPVRLLQRAVRQWFEYEHLNVYRSEVPTDVAHKTREIRSARSEM
jgi:hypothetical protein